MIISKLENQFSTNENNTKLYSRPWDLANRIRSDSLFLEQKIYIQKSVFRFTPQQVFADVTIGQDWLSRLLSNIPLTRAVRLPLQSATPPH
jgi:hypothetical protein